jgi:transcriptional regulator with XRE-family HTH domain
MHLADFADEVRLLMAERGMSLRGLARAASYDPSHLSKVLNGRKPYSPYIAARLDEALDAGGKIKQAALERPARSARPGKQASAPEGFSRRKSRVAEALQTAASGGVDLDSLFGLILHYSHIVSMTPSTAVYDELLSVRSFAGSLLDQNAQPGNGRYADIAITAGWLSSLLAISATDLGDHAAALVWCSDTERRGRDAGHPELLGWATLTRALIAYYQGHAYRSAELACAGQEVTSLGTLVHAKLAAQEMRSRAMQGDADGMADAWRRAATAMERLPPGTPVTGAFSIPNVKDPPYVATSLLLVRRYQDAAEATSRIIETVYRPGSRNPRDQPAKYGRTLLILGLAEAGLGRIEQASAAGCAAMEQGQPAWTTMVLARKLGQALAENSPASTHTADYRLRYIEAFERVAAAPARWPGTRDTRE